MLGRPARITEVRTGGDALAWAVSERRHTQAPALSSGRSGSGEAGRVAQAPASYLRIEERELEEGRACRKFASVA